MPDSKTNLKNESNIQDLWDNIKCSNPCIIRVPEGEERENGTENIFEKIMVKNCPNWDYPGGPVVKNPPSNAGDEGSIPHRGTKILHAMGQLSPCTATTEPMHSRACTPLERSPRAIMKSPRDATKDPACCNKDPTCHN